MVDVVDSYVGLDWGQFCEFLFVDEVMGLEMSLVYW